MNENEEEHKVILHDKPEARVFGGPWLWFGFMAIPVVIFLLSAAFRQDAPVVEDVAVVAPIEAPVAANGTRGGLRGGRSRGGQVSVNNPVIAPALRAASPQEFKCDFTPWVGLKMQREMVDALKGASGVERPYRILPPGTPVTKDYRPTRVNFDVDEAGVVTRIWCG